MDDVVFPQYPRHISRKEQGWLDDVRADEPEPVKHRCGRCANPFTGGRDDCPGNRPRGRYE